jgi:hypothetical protein
MTTCGSFAEKPDVTQKRVQVSLPYIGLNSGGLRGETARGQENPRTDWTGGLHPKAKRSSVMVAI